MIKHEQFNKYKIDEKRVKKLSVLIGREWVENDMSGSLNNDLYQTLLALFHLYVVVAKYQKDCDLIEFTHILNRLACTHMIANVEQLNAIERDNWKEAGENEGS